jgi:predicted alpha-1,2-mannosidase
MDKVKIVVTKKQSKETELKHLALVILLLNIFSICLGQSKMVTTGGNGSGERLISYVNPFIGVDRGGNQNPGPFYPFGMIHLSPINVPGIDPASYLAGKKELYGIGLINLIGTGCANFGNIIISADFQKPVFNNEYKIIMHDSAEAGKYTCFLENDISLEMTGLTRSGIIKVDFGKNAEKYLKIDLSRMNTEDSAFYLKKEANGIIGFRDDGQFCGKPGNTRVYFYISIPNLNPDDIIFIKNRNEFYTNELLAKHEGIGAIINLSKLQNPVEISAAVSFVSIKNAKLNLEQEIANKNFPIVLIENQNKWTEMLSRITVEGGTVNDKIKFYTAIYHTMSHPNILNDVNGEYPSMEKFSTVKKAVGNRYTLYSLWDTYRNLHPFMSLVYPGIQSQMVQSMVDMYNEYGWLPHWECFSREKGVMNGDPACIVINDTYQRGIRDFDVQTAYKAMLHNSKVVYKIPHERDRTNVEYIRKAVTPYWENNGYIPAEYRKNGGDVWGTVSTTLEYNLSDWNIAQLAKALNKKEDYTLYSKMSEGWQFLFDTKTGFIRQRNSNGTWVEPFNSKQQSGEMSWDYSGGPGYTEGNAYQYNFFVPHDIRKLIQLLGGEKPFANRLQNIFDLKQYEPTNEPDIAYPFLFNYAKGEEWRTQKIVRGIIEKEYSTGMDGIPGNDDTGTMSAWLIFAMMGFYPDCPGNTDYQICSPIFDKITISLDNKYYLGKKFVIETKNNSKERLYIKSMLLNGINYAKYQISHQDIVKGGKLEIELTDEK